MSVTEDPMAKAATEPSFCSATQRQRRRSSPFPCRPPGQLVSRSAFQLTATNSLAHYAMTNIPPGLSLNRGTGLLTGTPTATGVYNSTITVEDAYGTGQANAVVDHRLTGIRHGVAFGAVGFSVRNPVGHLVSPDVAGHRQCRCHGLRGEGATARCTNRYPQRAALSPAAPRVSPTP
ncbi:MAG: putative Ig domain-containing protein [Opitutaceae bacterium]|nr:putative Ig domain-containing protein [Opitutaceae bacterium]